MALTAGAVLHGRYRLLRPLGTGGMGSVYLVEDLRRPGTVWALKQLLDDGTLPADEAAQARARFTAEIALMRRLRHPRLPRFVESFDEGGARYFVMEFIPGGTLDERLAAARAPLPERDVLRWALAVCDALTYLHGQRPPIIVRDLKPGNIMLTPSGDVRLIDLGIARTYKPGQLSNTENLGTMTYASPEHLGQTQTDPRSDLYSLGATLYHLLTYVEPTPLETPPPGALRAHVPALSAATEAAVIRAMQLDPARRFQSAAEMHEALAHSLAAIDPAAARAPVPAPRTRPPVATRPVPAAARVAAPARGQAATGPPAAGPRCPRCGHANRPSARFCARDGTPLQAAAAPPLARPAASMVATARPPRGTPRATRAATTVQLAREAYTTGHLAAALRHCETAISQGAANYDLYLLQGRALQALGRHGEAVNAFGAAARLRTTAEAYALEAQAARATGDDSRALLALTRARQLDPRDPDLCYQLGLVCRALGQLAQAEGELEMALALRPGDQQIARALTDVRAAAANRSRAPSHGSA
ncbi:MAG TPA: protein kinase [Ktedonobacterales bacterium]|nr:protein kinase [Ktedonobacterales bacterium]